MAYLNVAFAWMGDKFNPKRIMNRFCFGVCPSGMFVRRNF